MVTLNESLIVCLSTIFSPRWIRYLKADYMTCRRLVMRLQQVHASYVGVRFVESQYLDFVYLSKGLIHNRNVDLL